MLLLMAYEPSRASFLQKEKADFRIVLPLSRSRKGSVEH